MPARPRLLIYRTGDTHPDVVRDVGDYIDWFGRVFGERASLVEHVARAEPSPPWRGLDGVVVTGSPLSLVEPEPWMDDACAFLRRLHDEGVPVLGVCFGHQLVGRAFGGSVRQNPRGWEAGTHEVELTDEGRRDPLFAGLPPRLPVNQSHRDEVDALGPDTVRLAVGDHSAVQAIAIGDHVRGVQFHPEIDRSAIRRILRQRHQLLTDDAHRTGRSPHHTADALLEQASETPQAEQVLLNFLAHFASRA